MATVARDHDREFLSLIELVEEAGRIQAEEIEKDTGTKPENGFWRVTPAIQDRAKGTTLYIYTPDGAFFRQIYPTRACTADTVRIFQQNLQRRGFDIEAARTQQKRRLRDQQKRAQDEVQAREDQAHTRRRNSRPAAAAAPKERSKKWPREELSACDVNGSYAEALLAEPGGGDIQPRPISEANIQRFMNIMLDELWLPSIMEIDWYGLIVNGNHRLEALRRVAQLKGPDWKLPCRIIFGVDPAQFAIMDTPRVRSGGDTLYSKQLADPAKGVNPNRMSAALRMLWFYKSGEATTGWSKKRMENGLLVGLANRFPLIYDAMEMATVLHTGRRAGRVTYQPSSSIVFCYLAVEAWPECGAMMDDYMLGVTRGENVARDDPRKALYNFMLGQKPGRGRRGVSQIHQLGLLLKLWNHFCTQQPTPVAAWKVTDQMPVAVTGRDVVLDD